MKILIASQNVKKRQELQDLVLSFDEFKSAEVLTLGDAGITSLHVEEDAETFGENAEQKLTATLAALNKSGTAVDAVMADDSGLCVDALDGAPGVRSARFAQDAGFEKSDQNNNALLMERLKNEKERSAYFKCAVLIDVAGVRFAHEGKCLGRIAQKAQGENGFGYDPYFVPNAHAPSTMAQISAEEKQAISHRGEAVRGALGKWAEALAKDSASQM